MPDIPKPQTTALPEELAKFSAMAEAWWDPDGDFKPLHRFNPARLEALRDAMAAHFGRDITESSPFSGLTLADVGCGGGLLSEPLTRLGFQVTGIDAAERNIGVARAHAKAQGLDIDYRVMTPEALAATGATFDAVIAMEVVEHVADPALFLKTTAALVKPGGFFAAATLNRTLKSLALAKVGAEYVLRWLPPGTHDWRRFMRPSELAAGVRRAGLELTGMKGMTYKPLADRWRVTGDLSVNYMVFARKP